jgi:hypothetical protein
MVTIDEAQQDAIQLEQSLDEGTEAGRVGGSAGRCIRQEGTAGVGGVCRACKRREGEMHERRSVNFS